MDLPLSIRPVYIAAHLTEAELVRGYLEQFGIHTRVQGAYAGGALGELPADSYPRLYLEDETQAGQARELIRRYELGTGMHAHWICRSCGETSPGTFTVCWNCQASQP